eukprot:158793-Chlamydomonas_euryale.AAC.1
MRTHGVRPLVWRGSSAPNSNKLFAHPHALGVPLFAPGHSLLPSPSREREPGRLPFDQMVSIACKLQHCWQLAYQVVLGKYKEGMMRDSDLEDHRVRVGVAWSGPTKGMLVLSAARRRRSNSGMDVVTE